MLILGRDYVDMIDDKWLSDVVFTTVQSGADLSRVRTSAGDFQSGALSKAVNRDEINELTVRTWLARAGGRKSTIVFCVDLAHVSSLTAMFRRFGYDARFVTGDTPRDVRQERIASFRAGKFPVLLNCGIFTEGTDIPNIDCVLLARPTKSRNLLVQMIGRGLRKHTDKQNCYVIDMVASLESGIVTTPTLFGLDPDELVEAADARAMKARRDRKASEAMREAEAAQSPSQSTSLNAALTGKVTFTDYDNVNDLIDDTSGERHIRAISPHAWVQVEEGRYILTSNNGDFITVKLVDSEHVIMFNQTVPGSPGVVPQYMRPRSLGKAATFDAAVRAADTYAKERFPFVVVNKNASWRRFPATPNQVEYLNKFRAEGEKLTEESITKGKAGDQITKLKHGARGRFNRIIAQRNRANKAEQRKQDWSREQQRQQVKVGPVDAI